MRMKRILSTKYIRFRKLNKGQWSFGMNIGSLHESLLYLSITLVKYNITIGRDKYYEEEYKSKR